jgi:hypothetical protein
MSTPNYSPLTYQTLIDSTLSTILSLVQNKDGYSSSVPAEVKPGYSITTTIGRSGGLVNGTPCYFTFTLSADTHLNTVTTETITNEFNQFMTDRGIMAKASSVVTTRGLINFFNNIAAFCSVKLILVTGQNTASKVMFYNQVENTYPVTSPTQENELVSATDFNSMLNALNSTINNATKLYIARYTISSSSSSSSSSCSSSCSSSSSSSSSSTYIAYFNLD